MEQLGKVLLLKHLQNQNLLNYFGSSILKGGIFYWNSPKNINKTKFNLQI